MHTLCFPVNTCSKLKLCYSAHLQATKVEALSLCLVLAVGFRISFMRTILSHRHQNWSTNHLGEPMYAGGQNRCKVTFADSSHVSVLYHLMSSGASRSISDCSLKSLWGEAMLAVPNYLYELLNSKAFWSVQVETTVLQCDRSGNPSEDDKKSSLNNSCWTPATCTGKQAWLLSEADGQSSGLLETFQQKERQVRTLIFPHLLHVVGPITVWISYPIWEYKRMWWCLDSTVFCVTHL